MKKLLTMVVVLLLSATVFAQNRVVSGTVKDETGTIVPFATVEETGTRNAVTADANGNFSIKMKGNGSLTVSAIGFSGEKITPSGNSLSVTLKRKSGQLSEVIITTALGQKRQARELGYAVSSVTNKTLTQAK